MEHNIEGHYNSTFLDGKPVFSRRETPLFLAPLLTLGKFVIPAKQGEAEREPGSTA